MRLISSSSTTVLRAICLLLLSQLATAQIPEEAAPAPPVHHSLRIVLDPDNHRITVEDTINLAVVPANNLLRFSLNSNLTISNNSGSLQTLSVLAQSISTGGNTMSGETAPTRSYELQLPGSNADQILLIYSGTIFDVAEQFGAEYAQNFAETTGVISEQGVYLNKASAWIPDFGDGLITFDLQVEFAESASSWTAVSQGDRANVNGWSSPEPMEEVYLIAADFTEYSQQSGDVEVLAYLRQPDPNLAARYMSATERYLALYEPLLGEYPYSKFALIENFWETGYGMPSFTLLGSQVIRFPFILESSYPHEILHNWWGNGVYPDYATGNWSEGLTAYLADHLFREMDGAGAEYRKEMLARFKNYVADGTDFPLSEFTSRNSAASQAVGYGKTLMLWHMLRIELGDELFVQGLRKLYQDFKFARAGFDDIEALYSELSGIDLQPFFAQWVGRTGAPELSMSVESVNGNRARIMFAQIQAGDPYRVRVPVALYYAGAETPQLYDIELSQKLEGFMVDDYANLQGVLVDPYFDVFRLLDREETPPTIGELFGASEITFVLPQTDRQEWSRLADAFAEGTSAQVYAAEDLTELPSDRSVWILGKDNPFANSIATATAAYGAQFGDNLVNLAGNDTEFANRSTVVIGRHPANPELAIGWIHIDSMVALPGMIEKLPHYGKYSYLSFLGAEPTNDLSGIWTSPTSPMQWIKPELTSSINWNNLPASEPLTELPAKYRPQQLLSNVNQLSAGSMQGRGLGTEGIGRAAAYIADQFGAAGLQTVSGTYLQNWEAALPDNTAVSLANVVGMIAGANPQLSTQPVIVGAHYDHLGIDAATGLPYPGADDNASGVSIMLEVAASLARSYTPQRPILFVAFSGEESGLLGSQYFVSNPPGGYLPTNLFAMLNLASVGRLDGRQLQVFGSESAYEWPFMAQGIGFTIGLHSQMAAANIASSDHISFLNAGIPAIHLFAGAHNDYHRVSDTPDKLDLDGMSSVALWLEEAIVYLADNTSPLRVNLANAAVSVNPGGNANDNANAPAAAAALGQREASLGTVPDFSYQGNGVRISDIVPGSAAAEAGLAAGDILLSINDQALTDLQTYSNLLRQFSPGDRVSITARRQANRIIVEATLKAR